MSYVGGEIEVLSGLEAIRRRPEMYAGKLDDPSLFNRLTQEALCLAVDEAVSGYCTQVRVSVSPDGSVTVRDNGRGLCMTPDARGQVPAEALFTKLYACRESKRNFQFKQSCCEMGIVVVNALSEWFCVRNFQSEGCWIQEYHRGEPLAPFRLEAEAEEVGLELSFLPDPSIVSDLRFDARKLARWVSGTGAGFGPPKVTKALKTGSRLFCYSRRAILP